MNNYRSEYEKYYGNIKTKTSFNKNNKNNIILTRIFKKITKQLICTSFFLLILLVLKNIHHEKAQACYLFLKESVEYDLDVNQIMKNTNIEELNEYIEKLFEGK